MIYKLSVNVLVEFIRSTSVSLRLMDQDWKQLAPHSIKPPVIIY